MWRPSAGRFIDGSLDFSVPAECLDDDYRMDDPTGEMLALERLARVEASRGFS